MGHEWEIVHPGQGFMTMPLPTYPRITSYNVCYTKLLRCGPAAMSALSTPHFVATLDLRIDYMRPAEPRRDIIGEAECYHLTRNIAFTRAWAYHESRDKVIATAAGAFAINKPRSVESMREQYGK